jgi:hypothetical protein
MILLISASCIARIIEVSHLHTSEIKLTTAVHAFMLENFELLAAVIS